MDKKELTKILNETATLLELKDSSFFKVRAYRSAARSLESSDINIDKNISTSELQKIKGIGKGIAGHIADIVNKGSFKEYEELKASTPAGLADMLKIPGMGAKKVKYLYDNLGVTSTVDLEKACMEDRLLNLPGFGKKTQDNILKGIGIVKKYSEKYLYGEIIIEAEKILEKIKQNRYVKRASLGGSVRRKKEIVKDIDIVASTDSPDKVMDYFTSLEEAEDIIARGDTKSSIRLKTGINVDIRTVEDWQFPYALHHFTGSREHNTSMRSMARKAGVKMNEYGLFKNGDIIKCRNEEDIFEFFSMQYIPPELRENYGEIEAAKKGMLPELINDKDIRGLIHIHTTYSDGKMTLEQISKKAQEMGLEYIGISDHSKSAYYAGGLSIQDIEAQLDEIDSLNKSFKRFKIFKGIESDILNDGSLDYNDRILEKFDFVIIAIHSNFNMTKEQITERIVKAMQNRHAAILAHPTGRLLLSRDPYEVDIEAIIDAAQKNNVDIELNSSPFRLDLDWRYLKYAKERNIKIFIDPDAHSLENLYDYRFGVNIARKGWLEKDGIANTMDAQNLDNYFKKKKETRKDESGQ
jgi:DNA polymerase (family X)